MDKTGVFNLALDASGSRHTVTAPTEKSREAEICNRWYDPVVDQVLSAAFWPTGRGNERLALQAERDPGEAWVETDPDPGWLYSYAAPSDMLHPRHMSDYSRFVLGTTANERRILTNTPDAILTYSARQTNVGLWDPELLMAIVYALAAHITLPLQGKPARAQLVGDKANQLILQARVSAANSDENQQDSIPPWLSARGYTGELAVSRYIYPYGPLINVLGGLGVG